MTTMFISLILGSFLSCCASLFIGSFRPIEWPDAQYRIEWVNECPQAVSVHAVDFDWDPLVATMAPTESFAMKGHLGQRYFAVRVSDWADLGNYTVHWRDPTPIEDDANPREVRLDWENVTVRGGGYGRRFIIQCSSDNQQPAASCAANGDSGSCSTTKTHVPRLERVTEEFHIDRLRHVHETSRVKQIRHQIPRLRKYRQPYTSLGFLKYPKKLEEVSPEGWAQTIQFYNEHKDTDYETYEAWDQQNTYVNHWEVEPTIIQLPWETKKIIWRDLSVILGEWANIPADDLVGSSIYGVRRYWNGSILENHVDRAEELILSVIINVDQGKMDEEWPLQIFDHDGNPYIVFMEPGDIVLYESSLAIHGRPLAMRGEYFANIFAHTKPRDWNFEYREQLDFDYL